MAVSALPVIRSGTLEARLARTQDDIDRVQELRYEVFYREKGATLGQENRRQGEPLRDEDSLDKLCDHLMVIDRSKDLVVGTYRLIRREVAAKNGAFYTASEYDISRLVNQPGELMELGRSCVMKAYRTTPTLQMLWRGIIAYMEAFDVTFMFGCGSFHGVDPQAYNHALSYLYHFFLAPEAYRSSVLPEHGASMNMVPKEAIDLRQVNAQLPPLIRGYMRIGGFVGDGAFIDRDFNTTDVCVILKTSMLKQRYATFYGQERTQEQTLRAQVS